MPNPDSEALADGFSAADDEELGADTYWDDVETVRAKWTMDGARTIEEAAQFLEAKASWLRELASQGYSLLHPPIRDDYADLMPPASRQR